MDHNHFTPFIVDDRGPRRKPKRDRCCLILTVTTATCAVCWAIGMVLFVMMIGGNWHAASSMQNAGQHEVGR